tara:strand:- start:720 stop:1325 length:606 start_codon:yes stop_codon:yes gene_type:complete
MIIVGLTGGIASGKTTILNLIKIKKIKTHDSDLVVRSLYKKPSYEFLNYLRSIGFKNFIKNKKINKNLIKRDALKSKKKLIELEKFLHQKVQKSRNAFLKKNKEKKRKLVVLDIPLLFEKKLEKICNLIIYAACPVQIRIKRALKRKNTNIKNIKKIISLQLEDKYKIKKADYIIDTSKTKNHTKQQTTKTIKKIYERSSS